jgi:penicillin amidase
MPPAPPTRPSRPVTALAALLLAALLAVGARATGPVPALGALLDPARGVWGAAASAELPRQSTGRIPGLGARVRVVYDDRAVPHIFADTEEDAWRALGWVVARDRLFQLELQTRAASGRITELAGRAALGPDREMRELGLTRAAERKMAALDPASPGGRAIRAYADGINAHIGALSPADWPLEYRLLGARPSRWESINTIHLMNRMGWTLVYSEDELRHARLAARVGRAAADALLPVNSPIQEPIQPTGRGAPRYDRTRLPPPGEPEVRAEIAARGASDVETRAATREPAPSSISRFASRISCSAPSSDDALGSNNWAVSPSRSATGHALLAGDPHLELTLPSIWYEAHLVVPGVMDVYGVTIPGAPAVIIGFNRDVAWTFTNTQADVADWYVETVDDDERPMRYRLDGAWRPLELRVETYRGQRGEILAADTLRFTHRGPLRRVATADGRMRWLSLRWTVLEPSDDNDVFVSLGRARSVAEFRRITERFVAPAQNMLVADRSGAIAIRSTGRFPIRPGDGRGDVLRDGSASASDWTGWWAPDEYPQAVSPAQGFLASANQQPVDPAVEPRYLGADWYAPWRAMRINELLRADSSVTVDEMRRFQTDPRSPRAELFRRAFLDAARARASRGDTALARAAALLAGWDGRYTTDNERAVLLETALGRLDELVWDELRAPEDGDAPIVPAAGVLVRLLADTASAWWDDRATPRTVERRDDILAAALRDALPLTIRTHGEPDGGGWRWDRVRHADIHHLLRIPSLSALDIPVQGGPGLLNPSSGSGRFGASWRMVVELAPEVRAWGTYPGGQSGNPASPRYTDRLTSWRAGALDALRFPRTPDDLRATGIAAEVTLDPEGR